MQSAYIDLHRIISWAGKATWLRLSHLLLLIYFLWYSRGIWQYSAYWTLLDTCSISKIHVSQNREIINLRHLTVCSSILYGRTEILPESLICTEALLNKRQIKHLNYLIQTLMIASVNLCRLLTAMSCFMNKRDDETTHYLKPPQAYIMRTIFVGTVKTKAQQQQTQIQ